MPEALAKRLEEDIGLAYIEGYGLSETMAACHLNPPARPKRQCLGIPFIGVTSLVVDPETLRELPQGEVGEILVSRPAGLQGLLAQARADGGGSHRARWHGVICAPATSATSTRTATISSSIA